MATTATDLSLEIDAPSLEAAVIEGAEALGVDAARLRAAVVAERRPGLLGLLGFGAPRLRVRVEVEPERPRNGGWAAAYFNGGLQLLVRGPTGGGDPIAKAPVVEMLQAMDLTPDLESWVDKQIVAATAQPFGIPPESFGEVNGAKIQSHESVAVIVQPNGFAAWLVATSFDPGRPVLTEHITAALDQAGITHGRDQALINRLNGKLLLHPLVIARGREVENGRDASVDVCLGACEPRAATAAPNPTDHIDYRNVTHEGYVPEGMLLARKTPATEGVNGVTVFGDELPATDGADSDLEILAGKNTEVVELDGARDAGIRATVAGNATSASNKVDVEPLLDVSGDVDFSVGNIDFPGPVIVRGNVESGFEVKATGDVQIGGAVDGASVISGGDVTIRDGFFAEAEGYAGRIEAAGNVTVGFAAGGTIVAKGDVTVGREIVRTTIHAGGSVFLEGEGQIRGATVVASRDVRAAVIGGRLGAVTLVVAGSRMIDQELELLVRGESDGGAITSADQPAATQASPSDESASDDAPAPDHQDADVATTDDQNADPQDSEPATDSHEQTEVDSDPSERSPRSMVLDHVEPGVRLVVGRCQVRTEQKLDACQLIEGEGALVLMPIDHG